MDELKASIAKMSYVSLRGLDRAILHGASPNMRRSASSRASLAACQPASAGTRFASAAFPVLVPPCATPSGGRPSRRLLRDHVADAGDYAGARKANTRSRGDGAGLAGERTQSYCAALLEASSRKGLEAILSGARQ